MRFTPAQSLFLAAVGLVVILVFLVLTLDRPPYGLRLSEAEWQRAVESEDPAVAFVDGWPIRRSAVRARAEAQGLTLPEGPLDLDDDAVRAIVEEMVDQTLLALEARRRGLDRDPEVRRLVAQKREAVLSDVLLQRLVEAEVTDEALRRIYEDKAALIDDNDEVRVRQIVVANQKQAEEVAARLAAGESFADLARTLSIDEASKDKGGDLGFFTRRDMLPGIARVVFSLAPGKTSKPFKTRQGWHIVRVEARRKPVLPSFEAVQPELKRAQTAKVVNSLLNELRAKARIDYVLVTKSGA